MKDYQYTAVLLSDISQVKLYSSRCNPRCVLLIPVCLARVLETSLAVV